MRAVFRPVFILLHRLEAQRGQLFLWTPILFAVGIGLFFGVKSEPDVAQYLSIGLLLLLCSVAAWKVPAAFRPPFVAALCIGAGFANAGLRAHLVAAPVLEFRYYGPIEGRIVKIDRSASDAVRLTLDHVVLRDTSKLRRPRFVRVSLHGEQDFITPEPGLRVMMTGHLSPPPGPAEPGGFDFRRMAWFDRLGGVGYTTSPVLRAGPVDTSAALFIHRLRQDLSAVLQGGIEGQAGAFAATILTGDRSGITQETAETLRNTNLSHLLAISGLHMGLLTGAVFGTLRIFLACLPRVPLFVPVKKIAAIGAFGAGGFYLALSGWNVATERAFIMVSMMLLAILMDRQAISMRAVALAAFVILLLRPEVLIEPGFQMSFAATTGLVAVFSAVRHFQIMRAWPAVSRSLATIVLSSAVAGLVTAPFAAAHFNRFADYGLLANIISVPLMGAVVMPAAILSSVLSLIGLQSIGFTIMSPAINWILWVAQTISAWDGAVTYIRSPGPFVLPLLGLGGLFFVIWRGPWKALGLAPVFAGFVLWAIAERPTLLISDDGSLVGRMTLEGRALNKPNGAGFAARSWLENDGDGNDQEAAAQRHLPDLGVGDVSIAHIVGRGWDVRARDACAAHDIVIVNKVMQTPLPQGCLLLDASSLRRSGAIAVGSGPQGVSLRSANDIAGTRLWTDRSVRRWRAGFTLSDIFRMPDQKGSALISKPVRAGSAAGQTPRPLLDTSK